MDQPDKPTALAPDTATADDSPLLMTGEQEILRQQFLMRITKRLVSLTGVTLALLAALGYLGSQIAQPYSNLVMYVFIGGLIGGFVSIQQRLPKIGLGELRELSGSWLSIILIPVNGGIFAIVLHLMFLAGILQGSLFPEYHHPTIDSTNILKSFTLWMMNVFPADGPSLAKLFFWSFVAGFSERLVPQMIHKTAKEADSDSPTPS